MTKLDHGQIGMGHPDNQDAHYHVDYSFPLQHIVITTCYQHYSVGITIALTITTIGQ